MRRCLFAGGAVLALASAANTQSTAPSDDALSPAEIISKLTPADILPKPSMPGAGTKPDAGPSKPERAANRPAPPKPDAAKPAKSDPDGLERCLGSWDAATHMTRGEWARVCRQIVSERARRTAAEQSEP
jgi:hypothetical protein